MPFGMRSCLLGWDFFFFGETWLFFYFFLGWVGDFLLEQWSSRALGWLNCLFGDRFQGMCEINRFISVWDDLDLTRGDHRMNVWRFLKASEASVLFFWNEFSLRLIYGIHDQTFGIEQCLVSPNFSIRVASNCQHTKESTRQQGQGGVTRGKRWLRLQGPRGRLLMRWWAKQVPIRKVESPKNAGGPKTRKWIVLWKGPFL